ncbi:RNase P modulator RnpM [Lentibacillus sp. JNUCC-1]|uniref:RNase P modulator RnpM n=1 Tax=Lentibacillus sp. JNUCC-1 TaxID=2654513 RepID=UPI0012E762D2|nr:YlxR family protein [Lentibacillus sp. JNUCC-1]
MVKKKKIPLRKCVVTNEMKPKQEMIRVVRNKEGDVFVDETGRQNGRGAYVSLDEAIIEKAKKTGALNRQLGTEIEPEIFEHMVDIARGKNK